MSDTIEKAAKVLCQSDDPCCKGEGCEHGEQLYADSVLALLAHWADSPPPEMVEAVANKIAETLCFKDQKEWAERIVRAAFRAMAEGGEGQ